jgi:hypothetical protein
LDIRKWLLWVGMGGNFRIQSPADAAQIEYNLGNLRVAWGRVAMPFDRWQPNGEADPATAGIGSLFFWPSLRDSPRAPRFSRAKIEFPPALKPTASR